MDIYRAALAALLILLTCTSTHAAARPRLVVLAPTGQTREGLPVLTRHPGASSTEQVLTRGFSGRLLRLYAMEQEFLRQKTGREPQPAYLLLSNRQGGFPQFGMYLDGEKKAEVGWVDLHHGSTVSGRFGAMDQIFPHELLHVIVRQLAGEPRASGGNQVHAVGVRTDPVTAFGEGFAEHVQIMSADDPEAVPETRALRGDEGVRFRAERELARYARDLANPIQLLRSSQMRFLLWFSQSEQVLRYHAVKANRFARAVVIPVPLLARYDKYAAYLLQNVMPGTPDGPPKSAPVMLSTEGVVAHLFWRWVTDDALQRRFLGEEFYAQFGTTRADVSPMENAYLKIFAALHAGRPSDTAEFVRAYLRTFPQDAADAVRVVNEALLGQKLPDAPELWLANDSLQVGTTLFDQFRRLPRAHTFDINAATEFDWLTVPGVTPAVAARLVAGAPYRHLEDLMALSDVSDLVKQRVSVMTQAMRDLQTRAAQEEESLSLAALARPYLWRLVAILVVASAAGSWLARHAGTHGWWSAVFVAGAASVLVFVLAWLVTSPPWCALAGPAVVLGAPWALWRLVRQRALRPALQALVACGAASMPAILLSRSWW